MYDLYNIGVCTKIYEKLPFFAELLLVFQTTCQLLTHQSTFGHLSSSNKSGSQKMKMSIFRNKKKQSCTTFVYFFLFTHEFVTFSDNRRLFVIMINATKEFSFIAQSFVNDDIPTASSLTFISL